MNDLHFSSEDNRYQLILRKQALKTILNECAKSGRYETGGVMVGYYSDELDQAIVTEVSRKPDDSKSSGFTFVRGIEGLLNFFKNLWPYRRYYLGEWHFHPFAEPTPSGNDFEAIKEIQANPNYDCKIPLLLILGGNPNKKYQIRSFACGENGKIIELKKQDTPFL